MRPLRVEAWVVRMNFNGENWFEEYRLLSSDEREAYKECILDGHQRIKAIEYERFKKAVELMASNPDELRYNKDINAAEEVALTFGDECVYLSLGLKEKNMICQEVYNLVMRIDEQLTALSGERNHKNWTLKAMEKDKRWLNAREMANEVCRLLETI